MSVNGHAFGTRIRHLREAMDLSLRDLAERSGVSAPMLSQVERGETSPTLAVAAKIAGGLELTPLAAAAPRRGRRRDASCGPTSACEGGRADGHRYEVLTPPLPGPARRGVAAHARAGRRHRRRRTTRRCTRPAAARPRSSLDGRAAPRLRRRRARPRERRRGHLRRRPATPLREPRAAARRASCPSSPPACEGAERCPRPCSRRSGKRTRCAPERRRASLYIDLHLVHEVTSPQAFEGAAARRPQGAPAGPHARDRRPQRADRPRERTRPRRDPRSPLARAGRDARAQLRRVRRPALRHAQPPPGHRARDRPGAGPHAAGHDDRLRRLAHLHARRASARWRSASARARSSTCWPRRRLLQTQAAARCGSPTRASSGFGVTAKDLILGTIGQIGAAGRRRPRDRVRRRADRGALDGGPHDDLQHVDRGRRRAPGMIAPDDTTFEYVEGRPARRATSRPRSSAGARCPPTTARRSTPRSWSTPARCRRRSPGARTPGMVVPVTGRVPVPSLEAARPRGGRARARLHGARARHADRGHPARPRVHRLVHQLAHRGPARGRRGGARPPASRRRVERDGRARLAAGEGAGRGRRASTRSSAPPASTGARPAARCASA